MAKFGETSLQRLDECHPDLIRLFEEVIKHIDCTVLCGHRGLQEQQDFFIQGKSKLQWPNSKHNKVPALAADVMPYPVDWFDNRRITYFAGIVKGIALNMGIKIRWGGDFNQNFNPTDETFHDLPHFELVE